MSSHREPAPASHDSGFTLICSTEASHWAGSLLPCLRLRPPHRTIFTGKAFGAKGTKVSEIVFNTSLSGYQVSRDHRPIGPRTARDAGLFPLSVDLRN